MPIAIMKPNLFFSSQTELDLFLTFQAFLFSVFFSPQNKTKQQQQKNMFHSGLSHPKIADILFVLNNKPLKFIRLHF